MRSKLFRARSYVFLSRTFVTRLKLYETPKMMRRVSLFRTDDKQFLVLGFLFFGLESPYFLIRTERSVLLVNNAPPFVMKIMKLITN